MTIIEARAIEKAHKEYVRARKEFNRARLSQTTYRGIPYCTDCNPQKHTHHSSRVRLPGSFLHQLIKRQTEDDRADVTHEGHLSLLNLVAPLGGPFLVCREVE